MVIVLPQREHRGRVTRIFYKNWRNFQKKPGHFTSTKGITKSKDGLETQEYEVQNIFLLEVLTVIANRRWKL